MDKKAQVEFLTGDEGVSLGASAEPEFAIVVDYANRINFALVQNDVPILRSVEIRNNGDSVLSDVKLEMSADPEFLPGKAWRIESIGAGQSLPLGSLKADIKVGYLKGLNEAERGFLIFRLLKGEKVLAEIRNDIELLARNQWSGLGQQANILAAFVAPNDPEIPHFMKKAAEILKQGGHPSGLDGYQSADPKRVYMMTAAAWLAVAGFDLTYAQPPVSFETNGQKIRSPGDIAKQKVATCLDLTLLMSGLLEAIGLNSAVIFTKGHAFIGVWLKQKTFNSVVEYDITEIRKAIAAKEFVVFETTLLAQDGAAASFDLATEKARGQLSEKNEADFEQAVDIARARSAHIRPLLSGEEKTDAATHSSADKTDAGKTGVTSSDKKTATVSLPMPPDFDLPLGDDDEIPQTADDRISRWQRKLLDLTRRNRLLNFKETQDAVPFLCPQVSELEDKLAEGKKFRFKSLMEENPSSERNAGEHFDEKYAQSALTDRKELCVRLSKKAIDKQLTSLYRRTKSDMSEGGTNTLFLAAGFLRYTREGSNQIDRAPILLIPVELVRKSAKSDFSLRHYEDEVRVNSTLLELLAREFDIKNTGLEGGLPKDQSGIDLPKIFAMMRAAVREVPGFEVVADELWLSNFSFAKYLMAKDLTDRTEKLRGNRLVKHLIDDPEKPYAPKGRSGGGGVPKPKHIDARFPPGELITPLPADSSQQAAIAAVSEGHDLVIEGPPGTGKSQTIANIIAHCLAQKKSVLFVAEKTAALDVVYRRLKAYGLSDACLELHSNKTERRKVLDQLDTAWKRSAQKNDDEWNKTVRELTEERDRLNDYVRALHEKGRHGFSIFDAIGIIGNHKDGMSLDFASADMHSKSDFDELEKSVEEAALAYRTVGEMRGLESIAHTDWSHSWQHRLSNQVKALDASAADLAARARAFMEELKQPHQDDIPFAYLDVLCKLANICNSMHGNECAVEMVLQERDTTPLRKSLTLLEGAIERFNQRAGKLSARYSNENVARMPIDELDADWRKANAQIPPFSWLKKWQTRKLLQSYAMEGGGKVNPDSDIESLRIMAGCLAQADSAEMHDLPMYQGIDTDVKTLRASLDQVDFLQTVLNSAEIVGADAAVVRERVCALLHGKENIHPTLSALLAAGEAFDETCAAYKEAAGGGYTAVGLDSLRNELKTIADSVTHLRDWVQWVRVREYLKEKGLSDFTEVLQRKIYDPSRAVDEFRRAYMRGWLPLAIDSHPIMKEFSASWGHEKSVENFKKLDKKMERIAVAQMLSSAVHQLPPRDQVPRKSGLGILRHQLGLLRPSMSIRKLIGEISEFLTQLTPCVLMSPLSVAQYLPAGQDHFDVVIFDEASQITTWEAIGAIARGSQSVIVGDPKQLPPTNFFGRVLSDEENGDMEEYEKDLPSILEEASAAGLPQSRLNWHYRSRDEKLILFSNYHYYDNELITFPCPSSEKAVCFHKIDGVYDRGKSRTNKAEAQAIVDMLVERLRRNLERREDERETFGVITFNVQQQELILNLLDAERQRHPQLEWFFDDNREEPVIVKNLENIQGDERDVMLFSITFGFDQVGKISMSFGALNKDGGQKRLNVAVTRSRAQLHVFSSITADDIDIARARALGVRHLKKFLDYARRGSDALFETNEGSVGSYDSPFEKAVAELLSARGWEVRPQIGVSGFRIDLGIVHPEKPGVYLAGVECDGATYHSFPTARDRDRIREEILRHLGWEILRIWSTDWFYDSKSVCDRVHRELENLLAKSSIAKDNK